MKRLSIPALAVSLLFLQPWQPSAWGFGGSNSGGSGGSNSGGSGGSGGSNSGGSNSGGSNSGGSNSGGSNSGNSSRGSDSGGNGSSSESSSWKDPETETEVEKKAREKRLAELAEKLKRQQEIDKQKKELQEKVKETKAQKKPDKDDDYKIIVPQRVRNEAVRWLAAGGTPQASLLLRATMQALRRRMQARGQEAEELSDAAVIAHLVQTM